jgi:hypothetical protein
MTHNSGPTGIWRRTSSQGRSCSQAHASIADLTPATALAAPNQQRTAALVEIALGKRQRLLDP